MLQNKSTVNVIKIVNLKDIEMSTFSEYLSFFFYINFSHHIRCSWHIYARYLCLQDRCCTGEVCRFIHRQYQRFQCCECLFGAWPAMANFNYLLESKGKVVLCRCHYSMFCFCFSESKKIRNQLSVSFIEANIMLFQ